ncbi:MAG: carboxylesterase [Nitrosomonadaceae bacterium]|nr:carboxylesterase [Nitrosomonadaceae bacterium]|tara:strand:- start:920 stop:1603 length:684 start_codon:yes stop_codon:yes gene_type:complete
MSNISTDVLPCVVVETGSQPTHSIIWLHGLGADGHDFVSIVQKLNLQSNIMSRFIFPHAPFQPISINNGTVMRAWYDISNPDLNNNEDITGIHASQHAVEKIINKEKQSGIKPENIILAGFSQGGAIALHTGLRHPNKLAGILVLSSYLPLVNRLSIDSHPSNLSTHIFMAHGYNDTVVPLNIAQSSKKKLIESGYTVKWITYQMGHSVCSNEINDISNWLKKIQAN